MGADAQRSFVEFILQPLYKVRRERRERSREVEKMEGYNYYVG